MAIKQISAIVGGQQRSLTFGNMGFFDYAGEVYDGDPMELLLGSSNPKKVFQIVHAYVYAGLKSAGESVTPEQVKEWVKDMEFQAAGDLLAQARGILTSQVPKPGEQTAQAEKEGL
jgi:hypothetical protein